MATRELPSPGELHKYLAYDPATGELTWKARTPEMFEDGDSRLSEAKCQAFNTKFSEKQFGSYNQGYRRGAIMGRSIQGHRIAWAMYHGKWPEGEIDHINGKRSDNRIENLRDVTLSVNQRNRIMSDRNTSGACGVYQRRSGKWRSQIVVQRQYMNLGLYSHKFDAVLARLQAERQHGFSIRHGLAA